MSILSTKDKPRRPTTPARAALLPAQLQSTWAELARQGGLTGQKI